MTPVKFKLACFIHTKFHMKGQDPIVSTCSVDDSSEFIRISDYVEVEFLIDEFKLETSYKLQAERKNLQDTIMKANLRVAEIDEILTNKN